MHALSSSLRRPRRRPSLARLLRGGPVADRGRLPRYALLFGVGLACVWIPIGVYLTTAPLRYKSQMSLILPGSGASASVNLDRIGQASSSANSAFASNAVSPTETYKRLLGAERIVEAAARALGMPSEAFGAPRVELVDQTALIHVSVIGESVADAKNRGDALLKAFFSEIEALRADELAVRERGVGDAISQYRASVSATRDEISRLQRETGLISAAQYDSLVAEADTLSERLADLTATLAEKTEAVRAVETALGATSALAAAALRLHADTEFAALAERMSEQAAALSQATSRFGARHPDVRAARDGFEAARREVVRRAGALTGLDAEALDRLDLSHVGGRAELLRDLVTLDAERAGLVAERSAMAARLEASDARRMSLIEPAARLQDLQRNFSVSEAVFASAIARGQTAKADLFASYPLVQVLEDPSTPTAPSSPSRKLALAGGVAGTLFLGVGLLLGWIRRPLIDRLIAAVPLSRPGAADAMVPA